MSVLYSDRESFMEALVVTGPLSVDKTVGLLPKVVRALDELYKFGLGPVDGLPYYYKDDALVARYGGDIVGFINFRHAEGEATLNLLLGWVNPAHRRKGIYSRLWQRLVGVARERGAVRIWGSTHSANKEMQAFYKSAGRDVSFVTSYFTVPPKQGTYPVPLGGYTEEGLKMMEENPPFTVSDNDDREGV